MMCVFTNKCAKFLILTSTLLIATGLMIYTPQGRSQEASSGETLKFKDNSDPASSDTRPPMEFKDPGEAPLGATRPEYGDVEPDSGNFKTYVGYPKHLLGVYLKPMNLSSAWSYQGSTYNFTSAATGIGLTYRLQVTPLWTLELDYMQYSMTMSDSTVNPYHFEQSSVSLSEYSIKGNYCFLGRTTFYRQLCPGAMIGNDNYPVLKFEPGSNLDISKVQDIILGINLLYQEPLSEHFMLKAIAGYNYGTGIGNSGYETSKSNSSYYGDLGAEWMVTEHNLAMAYVEYKARSAVISGTVGAITDTWTTNSSLLGAKLGYMRKF